MSGVEEHGNNIDIDIESHGKSCCKSGVTEFMLAQQSEYIWMAARLCQNGTRTIFEF